MDKRTEVADVLKKSGLLPLFFHGDAETSVQVLHSLYEAGSRVLEYTNRGETALANFKRLRSVCDRELPGMLLGIGTVKDSSMADKFIDAGADFIVSPGIADDIYDSTYSNKILWIPGCMTPSEIMQAEQYGLTLIKLFPGNLLGPAFVSAVREVFPSLSFLPTGGVEPEISNLKAWFDAGIAAVGMGSRLISKKALDEKSYQEIREKTKNLLMMISEIRSR